MTQWQRHPEYDTFLLEHRGLSAAAIAEKFWAAFGIAVTSDSVSGRLRRIADEVVGSVSPESTPEARFEARVEAERRQTADRAMAREMGAAVKGQARWEEFLDIARGELVRSVPPVVAPIILPASSGTPETFVLLIGDVHLGKLVDPSVVGEGFGYSSGILASRFAELEARVWRLLALHATTAPWSDIRIHFLGDGVDGVDMRRGHPHRVDVQSAVQQSLALQGHFEAFLRRLASLGLPIEVIWDFGNHGRVGEFGVNLPADNWDFVAGTFLQLALRDVPNVHIDVQPQKYHLTNLGPYRVYSSHGDAVKGGDGFAGIPINGLARAIAKDVGLHRQLIDLYLTAHFHTPQDITTSSGRILMNGSFDGGDDYSVNQLKVASDPVQMAFGIHPKRGMTWQSRLNLAPPRVPTPVH